MTMLPPGVKVHLAYGYTDMRKGMDGLALLVQDVLHLSEMLDWVPAQLRVVRIRRPKYGCRACGTIHQAPAPERLIANGLATPGLIAQVLVSKYCDHGVPRTH
jgi:transposase